MITIIDNKINILYNLILGEMAEWSNAAVLKTVVLQGTLGSNPSLSVQFSMERWLSGRKHFFAKEA